VSAGGLLLSDSRFPAGGHAHSGGVEPAVTAGTVTDMASLEVFLRGRLDTAGLVAAGLAAAACARAALSSPAAPADSVGSRPVGEMNGDGKENRPSVTAAADGADGAGSRPVGESGVDGSGKQRSVPHDRFGFWAELDAEADARTPAPAQRAASRRQGRALLRAARVAWPGAGRGAPDWPPQPTPHHAIMLGAAAAAAGCTPAEAARIAAYQAVAGPTSAAVRLLALDPMRASAVLARLTADIESSAARAAAHAAGPLDDLPYPSAPALDLLAEAHIRAEARLFES
jgi:urease accessory protein